MPFEIRVSLSAQFIEFDKFVPELQRQFRRLMREAAAIYYNNIVLRMPVDTGFLAGSFQPIKDISGATGTPHSPNTQRRQQIYTHFGDRRTIKNPENGREYVTDAANILTEVTDLQTKYLIIFHFLNEIRYYPINDISGGRGHPPWNITEKATRAALAFINANIGQLVDNAVGVSVKQVLINYKPGGPPQRVKVR